jgi:hypothetical protein
MATSRSFGEFAKRLAIISKRVQDNALKTVQRAAIAADQTAVLKTPVDTGRARANWMVSIGTPNLSETPSTSADVALQQGRDAIGSYQLGQGGIFISNSVPYIQQLDQGSSAQAPAGISAQAIAAAKRQLVEVRLLDEGKNSDD